MSNLRLPETIASMQDLSALIFEIRAYNTWLGHESIKNKVAGSQIAPPPALSLAATQLLQMLSNNKSLNAASVDALVKDLEQYKQSAPSITLTLAGLPPQPLKRALVAWCRTNLHEAVLVTINVNSTLLGGMVVRSGSRVFDMSFRRAIVNNIATFPEVLKRV